MVKSLIERMNILAIKNSIRITVELPKKTFEIYADEEKLSRAFANIVSNCIRYAKSSINIIVKNIDSTISLEISDDGPGFDSNELSNIFDRFYKGKKGNFGLGLAISRNVIERHGGNISAENTGTGALFKISFSEK
jgi:two-component system sensor histidine kinase CssS